MRSSLDLFNRSWGFDLQCSIAALVEAAQSSEHEAIPVGCFVAFVRAVL